MTDDAYDALDRATLATWRIAKAVGWVGAALLAAVVLHPLADELATRFRLPLGTSGGMNVRPQSDFGGTWQFWAPLYGFRAGVSIIIGLAIGTVLGLKAQHRPGALAAVTSIAYVLIAWLAFEISIVPRVSGEIRFGVEQHGLPRDALEWSYSALSLIVVTVASPWARFMARRKAA